MIFMYGRDVCGSDTQASRREWLITNGIGGYAGGTISGALTRHYHALLNAALNAPLGRTATLVKLNEMVQIDTAVHSLYTDAFEGDGIRPHGYRTIESFHLDGTTPVWIYAIEDALLEKRVWMAHGENTTYIRYTLLRGSRAVHLAIDAVCSYRNHHTGITRDALAQARVESIAHGLRVTVAPDAVPYLLLCTGGQAVAASTPEWVGGYDKLIENERGTEADDDTFIAGTFEASLLVGESFTVIASTESSPDTDIDAAWTRRAAYEQDLITRSGLNDAPPRVRHLVLAADQFIVRRGEGHSVLAGFPWFSDWGRDTMIALNGLTTAVGRPEIAASVLRTFARYVDQGMLPNRFPDEGDTPEYNTVDATLWYFEAIRAYHAATGDADLLRDLFDTLESIITWHVRGTRYQIHVDPADGLLYSGQADVQLTWMDVKIDEWVVTPRTGKAVEINALWYNALMSMIDFARVLGRSSDTYEQLAAQVRASFARFWAGDCLYDVLDGPDGHDATLRPNQIFAVSLHHTGDLLTPEQRRTVVDSVGHALVTSHGLRSLSPDHPDYVGFYNGDRIKRDAAYHQGTVWAWLIGAFVEAHLKVYGDRVAAWSFAAPLLLTMDADCVGQVGEIFNGDAPFEGCGAYAQAWSVAELLRVWRLMFA